MCVYAIQNTFPVRTLFTSSAASYVCICRCSWCFVLLSLFACSCFFLCSRPLQPLAYIYVPCVIIISRSSITITTHPYHLPPFTSSPANFTCAYLNKTIYIYIIYIYRERYGHMYIWNHYIHMYTYINILMFTSSPATWRSSPRPCRGRRSCP